MFHHHHKHHLSLPCLHCHPHSFIRMVHYLIEKCLILHMSRDLCIKALAQHANIDPLVTLTVWRGLQRENRGFFQAYDFSVVSDTNPLCRRYMQRQAPRWGEGSNGSNRTCLKRSLVLG